MTPSPISTIERGIIYLMAIWSGGAQWAFPKLESFLEQHDFPSEHFHILDIDHHPELYELPELSGKIHGWGEALVIKDGKIVFVTRLGKDQKLIQENCEELLRAYAA